MNHESVLHELDPRSKLVLQVSIVVAAYVHTAPLPLLVLTAGAIAVIWLADESIRRLLVEFRYLVGFLAVAPLIASLSIRAPHLVPADAWQPGLSAYRVLLLVLVSVAIVRTTTPREAQAAIRWMIPGRPGRITGMGIGLVYRFVPVIRQEAIQTRRAMVVRGTHRRPLAQRLQFFGIVTFVRLLRRTGRISRAMRCRCFSWNPTLPPLSFRRSDFAAMTISLALLGWAVVGYAA